MIEHPAYELRLPFPPSVNNLFSTGVRRGKIARWPSRKYEAWRAEAYKLIAAERLPKIIGPVSVTINLTPPNRVRRDIDNFNKPLLDALVQMHVLEDDSLVEDLNCSWNRKGGEPGAFISIRAHEKQKSHQEFYS